MIHKKSKAASKEDIVFDVDKQITHQPIDILNSMAAEVTQFDRCIMSAAKMANSAPIYSIWTGDFDCDLKSPNGAAELSVQILCFNAKFIYKLEDFKKLSTQKQVETIVGLKLRSMILPQIVIKYTDLDRYNYATKFLEKLKSFGFLRFAVRGNEIIDLNKTPPSKNDVYALLIFKHMHGMFDKEKPYKESAFISHLYELSFLYAALSIGTEEVQLKNINGLYFYLVNSIGIKAESIKQ